MNYVEISLRINSIMPYDCKYFDIELVFIDSAALLQEIHGSLIDFLSLLLAKYKSFVCFVDDMLVN